MFGEVFFTCMGIHSRAGDMEEAEFFPIDTTRQMDRGSPFTGLGLAITSPGPER